MQNYKLKTDPYIKKTERIQRLNKKESQNLFVYILIFVYRRSGAPHWFVAVVYEMFLTQKHNPAYPSFFSYQVLS